MIIVKGRELLVPENERYIGTTYDDNSTVRTFRISRFHEDGMDKSQLDFYVIINYDDGSDPDAVGVVKSVNDDYIVLEWDVGEDVTEHTGCLYLWMRGFDHTGTVRWSSFPGVFYIEGSGTAPTDLSDLETRIAQEDKFIRLAKLYRGHPMTAATAAEMVNREQIYVYVGNEVGYSYGYWYFWNGSAWTPGGVYNAVAVNTDDDLIAEGIPADARAAGEKLIHRYDTVAQMKADTTLGTEMYARTGGYYVVNDGGGALYRIESTAPETYYETLSNGLYARLVLDGSSITPEVFGAVGSGSADDTTAINQCFAYAKAKAKTVVMFGTYKITDTITVDTINIFGDGSKIIYAGTRDKPAVDIVHSENNIIEFGKIVDVDSVSNESSGWHGWSSESYIGLKIEYSYWSRISVRAVINFTVGIQCYANGNTNRNIGWCHITCGLLRNNKIQLHMLMDHNGAWMNANVFSKAQPEYTSGDFQTSSVQRYGLKQEGINYSTLLSCNSNVFEDFTFECNSSSIKYTAIYFVNLSLSRFVRGRYEVPAYSASGFKFCVVNMNYPYTGSNKTYYPQDVKFVDSLLRKNTDIIFDGYDLKYVWIPFKNICSFEEDAEYFLLYAHDLTKDNPINIDGNYTTLLKDQAFISFGNSSGLTPAITNYCLNNTSVIQFDDHKPYCKFISSGYAAIFIKHDGDLNTVYKVCSRKPYNACIKAYDASGNLITSDSIRIGDVFGLEGRYYSASYYNIGISHIAGTNDEYILFSASSNVAYIAVMFAEADDIKVYSTKQKQCIYAFPPNGSFDNALLKSGYHSASAPTSTSHIPVGTVVYDTTTAGAYWVLEKNGSTLSWEYYP